MKKKELNEFKKQTSEAIQKELDRLEIELMESRVSMAAGKESNLKTVRNIRKDRAQLLTIRTEMQKLSGSNIIETVKAPEAKAREKKEKK